MKIPARLLTVAALILSPLLLAVDEDSKQPPVVPKGISVAGKTLFIEKGCYQCHVAGDLEFPETVLPHTLLIELGSDEQAGWSRDDFARAILAPNHTVNPDYEKAMMALGDNFKAVNSPMPGFNDILTVSDLVHIATFLEELGN